MLTHLTLTLRLTSPEIGARLERTARNLAPLIALYITTEDALRHYTRRTTAYLHDLAERLGY